jgi:hypothetical protein
MADYTVPFSTVDGLTAATLFVSGGATFADDIAVNGGDITTTATTATIFNTNAATLSVGGASSTINIGNSTGITLNIGTATIFGGTKNINIGTNASFGSSTITIGNPVANINLVANNSGTITLGSGGTPSVSIPGNLTVNGNITLGNAATDSITVAGLLTATGGMSASGGITFGGTVASNSGYQITSATINGQTGTSYSLTASDNGKIITMSNGATSTVTIIAGLPVGYSTMVIQLGTGQVGFTAASGVTMNAYASGFKISGQHGAASIVSYATNIFNVSGTLSV